MRVIFPILAVLAVLILAVATVAIAYFQFVVRRDPYEANVTAVRSLGTPVGFTPKSETRLDSGSVRKEYSGCAAPCDRESLQGKAEAVRDWLRSMSGVQRVGTVDAENCLPKGGCPIPLQTGRQPELSNAWLILTQAGEVIFRVDFG
ncbi:hypothetical protein [Dactylosporangium sp. CA-233914]|uniref:hypothetical protein n=1 Tax=Dactylosporangium sp. CA-233914 TaxID=3239934 RepID=UPI003D8C331D